MKWIKWCHIAAIIHSVFISSAQEWVVFPENFSHVSNKSIYVGPQTDWFTAVKECHRAQANITLINTKADELMSIVTVLLKKNISSLWIEARRSASFHPITYHLPSSIYYGKNVMEPENSVNGLMMKWMENEPSLSEKDQCVVLILHNSVDGGAEIHTKLDKCGKAVHNFVCITYPCLNQDMNCWGQNTNIHEKIGQERGILSSPRLEIRNENNKYFLDVYSPEELWNSSGNIKRITNPVCIIEDGNPLIDSVCLLHQDIVLSWTSDNSTLGNAVQYSISKSVFRIISENEGYIVCRAFVAGTMNEIVTKRQLFRSDIKNHVFSVTICYRIKICSLSWCEPTYSLQNWGSLAENLSQELKTFKEFDRISVRAIRMSGRTESTVTLIFRIRISTNTSAGEIETDHNHLNNLYSRLHSIASNKTDMVEVLYVRSSKYCHEEKTYGNKILHWPVATIGQIVLPSELCVNGEGIPIQRHCIGDFVVGAFWSDENENNGTQYECEEPTLRASFLYKLSFEVKRKENATKTLTELLFALTSQDTKMFGNVTHFTPAEIHYTSNTLASLQHNILHGSDLPIIANITDAILRTSVTTTDNNMVEKKMTHRVSNASNVILDSIDHMLNNLKLDYEETSLIVTPQFVTLVMDIESSSRTNGEIQGLAALKPSTYTDNCFKKEDIMTVSWNDSVNTLLALGVSTAVLVPPQLTLQQTDTCSSSHLETCSGTKKHRLVINLFWDHGLFASKIARIKTPSHVVSVTLDGVKHPNLNPPLTLLFDNPRTIHSHGRKCVFWDFEANSGLGNWSDIGCYPAVRLSDNDTVKTDICICTHLTHFGHLLSPTLEEETNIALDIITIVGCSVSLLGLFGIAVTAIVFPEWRRGASRKIQLHLSTSLAILMSVFLVNSHLFSSPSESQFCVVLGVALHFSLVSTFCWMFVAAWFQYLRLTKPLASLCRTPHILLKTAVFAWGFPFIPCGTLLIVSPSSYNSPQCYPTGLAHYFSVIAPISIIVSLNIAMFVLIICSIYKLGNFGVHADCGMQYIKSHHSKQRVAYRRLSTLIFLFFLLGLSWIFGIWKFSYLFCCTTTIQGFAFFVFFIVLEKNARAKWSSLFAKNKTAPVHSMCIRYSSGSVVKRMSYAYERTSRNTVSTLSSLS